MPFNGTGTFNRVYSWTNDAANGIDITASRADTEDTGFATGLSQCLTRDGQGVPSGNLNWGSIALTVGSITTGTIDATGAAGSFTGTMSGFTGSVTGTVTWRRTGNLVMLNFQGMTGISNSTGMTMSGLPGGLAPATQQEVIMCQLGDNGAGDLVGSCGIATNGIISFNLGAVSGTRLTCGSGNFTASGIKGITNNVTIAYFIN